VKDWHIGRPIVCVDDSDPQGHGLLYGEKMPVKGRVYTIRYIDTNGPISFLLNEIYNDPTRWADEYGETLFFANRFRPLDESRIDQFRAHLNPKRVEEPA